MFDHSLAQFLAISSGTKMLFCLIFCLVAISSVGCTFLSPVEESGKSMTIELLHRLENDPSTEVQRTGFIRTDKYDWLNDMWIGSSVAPVGICIDLEFDHRMASQRIERVLIPRNGHIITVWSNFNSSGCMSSSRMGVFVVPREETDQQMDTTARWVQSYEEATMKDPRAGSAVVIK